MTDSPILLGNDHGGYDLKCVILEYLIQQHISVHDMGSGWSAIVRYPYYAARVAEPISRGRRRGGF